MKVHLILIATLAAFPCASAGRLAVHSQVDALVEEQEDKPIEDVVLQATRSRGLRGGIDTDHPKPPHPKPPMKATRTIPKPILNEKNPASKALLALNQQQCVDVPGWHDSDGPMYDCNFYAEGVNCLLFGFYFENFGYTASEACCVCGGGSETAQSTYETIIDYDCFRTVKGTNETMIALENDFPNLVTIMDIGYSYRVQDPVPGETGYTIRLVKITSTTTPQGISEKAKVFVVAGVHAREYAPPEIVLRFAEELTEGYGKDADITWILDHTEIYVLPIANPDGRQIAETDRELLWRKNRHFSGCSESNNDGVDINRNFPFKYGVAGTSDDPCSENFHGNKELSEVESQAIFDFAESIFPDSQKARGATVAEAEENVDTACGVDVTGVYLDLHSYGGLVVYPWGFAEDVVSPDDEELQTMARKLASFGEYGLWGPGQPNFEYAVGGDTTDTMYGLHCVASFGLEVGTEFYEECNQFEDEVFPINYESLIYAAKVASAPFRIPKGPDVLSLEIESTTSGSIIVTVLVSDEERSIAYGEAFAATGSQDIAEVRVFVDDHPYTIPSPNAGESMSPLDADGFNSPTESASLEIDTNSLSPGQHVVYIQAEDSAGFKGPISAAFFDVL